MREEFAKLDLRLNETKSRVVDLTQEEALGFLGFTFQRLRSPRGRWWALKTPAIALDILGFDRQGALKGRTASTPSHQPFASSFGERNRRT